MLKKILGLVILSVTIILSSCLSKSWTKEDFSKIEDNNFYISKVELALSPTAIKGWEITNENANNMFNSIPFIEIKKALEEQLGVQISGIDEIDEFKASNANMEFIEDYIFQWGSKNFQKNNILIRYHLGAGDGSWWMRFYVDFINKETEDGKEKKLTSYENIMFKNSSYLNYDEWMDFVKNPGKEKIVKGKFGYDFNSYPFSLKF